MHVCILCGLMSTQSGTPLHAAQQADALRRAGAKVDLLHLDELHPGLRGYAADTARSVGTGREGPLLDDRSRAETLLRGLCSHLDGGHNYDILHAHYPDAGLAAAFAAVCRGTPYAFSLHGYEAENARRRDFQRSSLAAALAGASVVIPVSEAVLADTRSTVPIGSADVEVIPDGYDGRLFFPAARTRRPGGPRVGFIGRGAPEKGLAVLCDAVVDLAGSEPGTVLVVAGAGTRRVAKECAERVPALRRRLELHDEVRHDEVPRLLRGLDVLAVPSLAEGRGSIVLEALATGLPVVASAVGGITETLTSGVNGVLVPPGSPAELARALRDLVARPAWARHLADQAVASSQQYEWRHIGERLLASYEKYLKKQVAVPAATT